MNKQGIEQLNNEEFGQNVMGQVEWIDDNVENSLEKELRTRGATKEQASEFSYLIRRLENDLSELAGSPDRGVAHRFTGNIEEFETLLKSIVGQDAFDEMDIYF